MNKKSSLVFTGNYFCKYNQKMKWLISFLGGVLLAVGIFFGLNENMKLLTKIVKSRLEKLIINLPFEKSL